MEVTNLGANRLRWNDRNGVDWKYFCDINVVGRDYKPLDTSKWKPLKSGLFGPVEFRMSSLRSRLDADLSPGLHSMRIIRKNSR